MTDRERRARRFDLALVVGVLALLLAVGVAVVVALSAFGTSTKVERLAKQNAAAVKQNAETLKQIERVRADTRRNAAETHTALCALREDLKRRVGTSIQYLSEHPNGTRDIPLKTIRDSVQNQQRSIASLHALRCP